MELNKYKFTIIIPVYNSEKWVEETIQSVIRQSIGFENIQLIIVDDGSTDNSVNICKAIQKEYPKNIKLICKENGGVAAARNLAMEYIEGEYVEFLDSDDTLSLNTLEKVYDFFQKNNEKIDLVSIPMVYFDGRIGPHYLNSKFEKGSRIIDLDEDPQDIMVHIIPNFIKSEVIKRYRFDESLATCEDSKLMIQLLLDNNKYGVLVGCQYNYRLRANEKTSLSQTAKKNKRWYIEQLMNYPLWAISYCQQKKKSIPDFVKYILASHLQWRFKNNIEEIEMLTSDENKQYRNLLMLCLKNIDDKIIDDMTQIDEERKQYMKYFKNNYREA